MNPNRSHGTAKIFLMATLYVCAAVVSFARTAEYDPAGGMAKLLDSYVTAGRIGSALFQFRRDWHAEADKIQGTPPIRFGN
jgi:hypothetical protein